MPLPQKKSSPRSPSLAERLIASSRELSRLERELAALTAEEQARKYDPSQPRVPAGDPAGGQWTSGGGGSGAGTWAAVASGEDPAGAMVADLRRPSLPGHVFTTADGVTVATERRSYGPGRIFERHTVTLPNNQGTILFENDGPIQTIVDGETGETISRAVWTPTGPQSLPMAEQVRAPGRGRAVAKAIEAVGALYTFLSARQPSGSATVVGFKAWAFARPDDVEVMPEFAGHPNEREAEQACPKLPDVQERTDRLTARVLRSGRTMTPAQIGSAIHHAIKEEINALYDPDYRAEMSFNGSYQNPKYGAIGTTRLDVYHYLHNTNTLCVFDMKTGRTELPDLRAHAIVRSAYRAWATIPRRILAIQVRPRP